MSSSRPQQSAACLVAVVNAEQGRRPPRGKARALSNGEVARAAGMLTAETKKAAREALRSLGVAACNAQIDDVLRQRKKQESRSRNRHLANASRRLGRQLSHFRSPTGRPSVRLPIGPVAQRLNNLRVLAVQSVARELFRWGASGGHTFKVQFATSSEQVKYEVKMDTNRDTYRGAYKGWRANEDHHVVVAPEDWRNRVLKRGLANVGGLMTLDAHPLDGPQDVDLYAAVWASQARGYLVKTHRGYIGLCEGEAHHAETAEEAVAGARRMARLAGRVTPKRPTPYSIGIEEFVAKYRSVDCDVTLEDARDTGSCEFGIRSWCEAVGLDYDTGSAPLAAVLEGFIQRPQVEVRRAVVHAVRWHRAAQCKAMKRQISHVVETDLS